MTVMITNRGIYLIPDEDQSWLHSPNYLDRQNLKIPELEKVERFSYEENIKKIYISTNPGQRIVIELV